MPDGVPMRPDGFRDRFARGAFGVWAEQLRIEIRVILNRSEQKLARVPGIGRGSRHCSMIWWSSPPERVGDRAGFVAVFITSISFPGGD